MMGVCFGLLMALCLLVTGIACRPRRPVKAPPAPERRRLKESSEEDGDDDEDDDDEDDEDDSMVDDPTRELGEVDGGGGEMLKVTVAPASEHGSSRSNGTLRSVNVFASAEELEKARRLEERERIVREIWRNGQPDILATGTGTIGRVHYH